MSAEQIVSAELFATILQAAHHPHVTEDDPAAQCPMQRVFHHGVLYATPLRGVA